MFKELFVTMNEVLDGILEDCRDADAERRAELADQFRMLKAMSDSCLEEWLRFEEKLADCGSLLMEEPETACLPESAAEDRPASEHFAKGQGYYKLHMFARAVGEFEQLVREYPDFLLGRVYLAMGYLRLGELTEAYRHFQLLVPLTKNSKLKAISYNAMGCIQVHNHNMDQAYGYFKMADLTDSSFMEPALWSKEFWPYRRT
ncbi:tetratricopeptide repeat protein [Gorillibacterium sp. sgz500922]|uniref:tetratricopeptide repeat protein n=1 Tax=Gorillibacterium sp. sgz500922 TaxID=3446694 RepID=UPI003F663733